MIHSLTGTVLETHKETIILDNGHNWSFTIRVCDRDRIPGFVGRFYVHFHLRQDQMSLYGFRDANLCDLFKLLITVKGCGPKTAIGMLNRCDPTDIINAVQDQNETVLLRLPGIGKRMAAQVILDLHGKLDGFTQGQHKVSITHQVIQSLIALGYSQQHCEQVAKGISMENHHDETVFLKLMLQGLKTLI